MPWLWLCFYRRLLLLSLLLMSSLLFLLLSLLSSLSSYDQEHDGDILVAWRVFFVATKQLNKSVSLVCWSVRLSVRNAFGHAFAFRSYTLNSRKSVTWSAVPYAPLDVSFSVSFVVRGQLPRRGQ